MALIIKIGIECALMVPLLVLSQMFWSNVKNMRYRRSSLQNGEFLATLIKQLNDEMPFSQRVADLKPREGNWAYSMMYHTKAEFQALSTMRWIWAALILAILVGSFFLGWVFLALNLALFGALAAIGQFGQEYALRNIVEVAAVLYCWRRDDPDGYRRFAEEAWALRTLRLAVEQHAT